MDLNRSTERFERSYSCRPARDTPGAEFQDPQTEDQSQNGFRDLNVNDDQLIAIRPRRPREVVGGSADLDLFTTYKGVLGRLSAFQRHGWKTVL
jgi:hypothetical protein